MALAPAATGRTRRPARALGALCLGLLVSPGTDVCAAPPVRAAPTRPIPANAPRWTSVRLYGADYADLRDVAAQLGFTAIWDAPARALTLVAPDGRKAVFERDQRDWHLDGLRIFLSAPAVAERDTVYVPLADLRQTVAPLLRPAGLVTVPPFPPQLIVLDAGHGGTDPGKRNSRHRVNEKDAALDVALRAKRALEARGYRVLLTREDDRRFSNNPAVDLPMRAAVANRAAADLFVSIHFNAVDPRDAARVSGSETYVLTPQHAPSTQPESDAGWMQEAYPGNRNDFANVLLGYALHRQLITRLQTSDRGYKRARFAVLRTVECPAVLVEAAYLSHDAEAGRVATPEFRQAIAEAIAEGIAAYTATVRGLRATAGD